MGVRDQRQESVSSVTIRHVLFRVGRTACALPMRQVRQVLRSTAVTRIPRMPTWMLGVTNLRGRVLPVVDLGARLRLPASARRGERVVVVQQDEVTLGYLVTQVLGAADVEEDAIEPPPSGQGAVATELLSGILRSSSQREIVLVLALDAMLAADRAELLAATSGRPTLGADPRTSS